MKPDMDNSTLLNSYIHLDPDKFRFIGQISTEHGTFAWAEKQTVFNESEIARQ